ncbi:hypothetical protein J18TS1_06530 [Oceanobacillus oncorhynchi subsp. incaldanensis]|uniref:DUF3278 domain-containing protein n=1 Tax=Oceanobacillus oncorhynchi TaxID=545501 RepID=UPI001B2C7AE9|nr:DUF3278 domain-containing protein [Oceanobacillus oncorhynchi]GIO17553.1 hypothetical protein J18TS1_06530 [Oceanobacillus oncorhynchi subsp. incaldanensis]
MKNKLLTSFIGTIDNRDEYQQQEIYKELALSGMLLWTISMLVMFVNLIIDTMHQTLSFSTTALFIINMFYAVTISARLRKKHLDNTDCASLEEYQQKKKQLKKSSTFAGFFWGFFMLAMMQYVFPYLSTGETNASWQSVLIWGAAGIFLGLGLYWFSKSKLLIHFER